MVDMDYLFVLKALKEIPFGVGKKLLVDFLRGNNNNDSITRNKLNELDNFGILAYDKNEIIQIIDSLLLNSFIRLVQVPGKFWKVMELSEKGENELINPKFQNKKLANNYTEVPTIITEKDRQLFEALGVYLAGFNDDQKKAITSSKEKILCIAGAGSGKTTVLTKRIEFMIRYRTVPASKILAITFTRKARQEMMARLDKMGQHVAVETFNSFCEKKLLQHNDVAYNKPMRVIRYADKIRMMNTALQNAGISMERALDTYFTLAQRKGKPPEQLAKIFMNDCFFVRDYFKFKNRKITKEAFAQKNHSQSGDLVFKVVKFVEEYMIDNGLRDFADQLIDAIKLFKNNPDLIPRYEHVLVDEYQDVNSSQIELLNLLKAPNLFVVGDPRQSIFGWRGSDIKYILDFAKEHTDCETVTLNTNYRSSEPIVSLINESIREMKMHDLESAVDGEKDIKLLNFKTESAEFEFVIQRIIASDIPRSEIFVLARTNKQLNELSEIMKARMIKHVLRNDESKMIAGKDDVTLATIHAIKGLEAEMVFVIGCTPANFPCKGSEHPVVEMVKVDEYDKEEEERRLFYVAMSRAKKTLYLSYTSKSPTTYITPVMKDMVEEKKLALATGDKQANNLMDRLKKWRKETASQLEMPAYIVMHDRTLIDIVQQMPMSLDDLQGITGMGPAKIQKYGNMILDLVGGK